MRLMHQYLFVDQKVNSCCVATGLIINTRAYNLIWEAKQKKIWIYFFKATTTIRTGQKMVTIT